MAPEKLVKVKSIELKGKSLYLFSPENAIRIIAAKMVGNVQFDNVILVFIMISTGLLTLE
jgi:hypothetical protein